MREMRGVRLKVAVRAIHISTSKSTIFILQIGVAVCVCY